MAEHFTYRLHHIVDVALCVHTTGNRKPYELHGRPGGFTGIGVDPLEHDATDFDGADTGVLVKSTDQRLSGKLIRWNVRTERSGVDIHGMSTRWFDNLYAGCKE